MNLLIASKISLKWHASVIRKFLRKRPAGTLMVIASLGVADITRLLAIFLPLKVILLAASPGVPRYFPFIDPDEKTGWIIGLTAGVFFAYALSLILESIAKRMSGHVGAEMLRDANELRISANDEKDISKNFAQFCESLAALVVLGAACVLLVWINPPLLGFILASVTALFIFTAWVLRGDELPFSKTKNWMIDHTRAYLSIINTLLFFGGFIVLLVPLLMGQGGNILLLFVALMLMRQMIGNLSDVANKAVRLTQNRHKIDALVFRNVALRDQRQATNQNHFSAWFCKTKRHELAAVIIAQMRPKHQLISADWQDSSLHGIKTLALKLKAPDGTHQSVLQQIVSLSNRDQIINESYLLKQLPRHQLQLPELIHQFDAGDYQCRILDFPPGQSIGAKQWPEAQRSLLISTWGIQPSKALIKHYRQTHPLLAERLTDELCRELEMGVDTDAEAQVLKVFKETLPLLRSQISAQPLVIYNLDLIAANVSSVEEKLTIMHWGRWRLEPLGTALSLAGQAAKAKDYLQALAAIRKDIAGCSWEGDLQLGALAWQWEQQIKRENYKAALSTASLILNGLQAEQAQIVRTA